MALDAEALNVCGFAAGAFETNVCALEMGGLLAGAAFVVAAGEVLKGCDFAGSCAAAISNSGGTSIVSATSGELFSVLGGADSIGVIPAGTDPNDTVGNLLVKPVWISAEVTAPQVVMTAAMTMADDCSRTALACTGSLMGSSIDGGDFITRTSSATETSIDSLFRSLAHRLFCKPQTARLIALFSPRFSRTLAPRL